MSHVTMSDVFLKNSALILRNSTCIYLWFLYTVETGDADVRSLHTSQFMLFLPSVSDVRSYLNVWSGSIMFLPPNITSSVLQASSDPFIHSLFLKSGVC
jgi:hypothetical protein